MLFTKEILGTGGTLGRCDYHELLLKSSFREALNRLNDASQQEALELQIKIDWMKGVEMCVVFSQEQKEQQLMEKWGRMFFRTGRRV